MIEPTNLRANTTRKSTINARPCRSIFNKFLVLVAALFSVASFSAQAADPVVDTVPWVPANRLIPHETWSGKEISVKAVADVQGSNYAYSWDFGDGSPVETGTVTDRFVIDARHTYIGTPGDVFTARLTVENTATGETGSDTYFVQIREQSLETEVNVAIDEGLWYLHKFQTRTTESGIDFGDWRSRTGCSACSTWVSINAANVNAFAAQGHVEGGPADDPYVETVTRGMRRLFTYLTAENISNRTYPDIGTVNPDSNGNGLGIRVNQTLYTYQGGMFMDAIITAGRPDSVAATGPANVNGRTYDAIVQDMVDSYAFGQYNSGSNRGGWRYVWNQGPDNSAAQWAAIGMIPAERNWALTVPDWVKSQNAVWLAFSQTTSGAEAGRFGYTTKAPSSWGPYAVTPSGMVQMVMDGVGRGDSRWDLSETWIRDRFANNCTSNDLRTCARTAIKDNYYGMFSFVKSMRLHEPAIEILQSQTAGVAPLDWYAAELSSGDATDGVARTLVDEQQADGRWTGNYYESRQQPFDTPWAVLMLGQTLFEAGSPVAVAQAAPNPGIAGQSISLNGTGSFHQDPERTIVAWEWDLDNDGTFETPGVSVAGSFPALGDYPVNLRVTDDSAQPRTAETTVIVRITLPPLPPTADAGGPYSFCPAQNWFLDGSGSVNPDEGQSEPGAPGDTIQQYAWDLDGDGNFDDTFGSQPDVNGYFGARGVGDYLVNLRVTDTTSISYPSSGQSDLTDTDAAQVRIRDAADAACTCIADLTARPKSGKVQLVWTDTGATLYNVYRGTTAGGPYQFLAATDSRYSTYLDLTVVNDTQYYYVVRETLPNGAERCQSIEATATPAARRRSTNNAPVIISAAPTSAVAQMVYTYDVDAVDGDGDVLSYSLDLAPAGMTLDAASGLIEWTPVLAQVGAQNVAVRVSDPAGAADTQTWQIVVSDINAPPAIVSSPVVDATESELYTYDVDAIDPNIGDVLAYGLDVAPAGMTIDPVSGLIQWTPGPTQTGVNGVTVRSTDAGGLFATQSYTVLVAELNRAPSIVSTPPTTATEGVLYTYDVEATDPNSGDVLTFSLDSAPAGMAIDASSGLIQWTPDGTQVGDNAVTVRADDGNGGFATQSYTIDVAAGNQPPSITSVPIVVATEAVLYSYDVEATDPDVGDVLTFSLDSAPAGMTIDASSGLIQWTPAGTQLGANAVAVRVVDGNGGFATQSYTIDVAVGNQSPSITSVPATTGTEGELYTYDVEATDPDAGDTLTFGLDVAPAGMTIDPASGLVQWTPNDTQIGSNAVTVRADDGNGGIATQSYTIAVSAPANQSPSITSSPATTGTEGELYTYDVEATDPDSGDTLTYSLTSAPAGMAINTASGLIQWTPASTQLGANAVTVRVADGNGGIATQSYTIAVSSPANQAPSITSSPATTGTEGELYTYDVEATDPDSGDVLTFSLDAAPAGMTIDASSGLIQWTPNSTQVGDNAVAVRAADGNGGNATQSYTIAVSAPANQAPSITSSPATTGTEGELYTYDVEATDPDVGDVLTFSLDTAPAGMTIDASSGLIQWTPAGTQVGDSAVAVRVVDGNGGIATQAYTIAVSAAANQAPNITSTPPTSGTVGIEYQYDVEADDPDGDTLTFSLTSAPTGMSIDPASGLISWTPTALQEGSNPVVVRASDGQAFAEQSFVVSVTPQQALQVSAQISPLIADPDELITITVQVIGAVNPVVTIVQNGTNLPVNNNTATFSASVPDVYPLQITVDSADGQSASITEFARVRDAGDTTPPTVSITAPANDANLSNLVDIIGTVDDANLFRYQLFLAPSGTADFTEFFSSTNSVVNDVLGTFDPSMSTNGLYRLVLQGEDLNGAIAQDFIDVQIDGDFNPGIVRLGFTDMVVPVAGIPITIERTYDSRVKAGRDLGIGWSLDVRQGKYTNNREPGDGWSVLPSGGFINEPCFTAAEEKSHVTEIRLSERESYEFRTIANFFGFGSAISGGCRGNVEFQQVDGIPGATLAPLESNIVFYQNGTGVLTFDLGDPLFGDPWEPGRVRLTTSDGRVFDLDLDDGIQRLEDRNGNQLFIGTNGVVNAAGIGVQFIRDGAGRITEIIDPLNNSVQYEYDAAGDLVGFVNQIDERTAYDYFPAIPHHLATILLPDGRLVNSFDYDADGRLAESCTELGCATAQYDLVGRTQTNFDATGRSVTYVYDGEGNVLSQTDGLGNSITYVYDADGNVIQQTDAEGNVTTQTWDASGYLLSVTEPFEPGENPADFTTTYTYDARGNMLSNTSPTGAELNHTYDAAGNLLSMTDENGLVLSSFTYDAGGRRLSETDPFGTMTFTHGANGLLDTLTDEDGVNATFDYDAAGNITSYQRDGLTATFTYDGLGRESTIEYDDGVTLNYEYDFGTDWDVAEGSTVPRMERSFTTTGKEESITQADGSTVQWAYDAAGRVIAEVGPLGGRTEFGYDAGGRLVSETDPLGNVTTYEKDGNGRILAIVNGAGDRREMTYYPDGRERTTTIGTGDTWSFAYTPTTVTTTGPLGRVMVTEANSQGLVTRMVNADGTDQTWTYLVSTALLDGDNSPTSVTDEAGRQRNFTYDVAGRLIGATDLANVAATYAYGDEGIETITDAENDVISFFYNARGDVETVTFGDGSQKSIAYTPASDVASVTLGSGASRTLAYDAIGRLTQDSRSTGEVFDFTWDLNGNLLTASDSLGVATSTYDATDNATSFTSSSGETLSYVYDAAGRIARQTLSDIAGGLTPLTDYEYDGAGRIDRIVDDSVGETTMTYDAAGRLDSLQMANGITTSYQYDARDQVLSITHENGVGTVISSVQYVRNAGGEPSRITWQDGSYVDIAYDAANRVTEEAFFDSSAVQTRLIQYEYDLVGNRTASIVDGVRTDNSYGAGHRILSATGGVPQTYTYDIDGRTATIDRAGLDATLVYNFAGQITSIDLPGDTITYRYDGAGRRIEAADSGSTRRFLKMAGIGGNYENPQAVLDDSANVLQRYVYAGDQPLARTGGGSTRYYLTDAMGSVIGITDDTGNLVGSVKYDAFGGQVETSGDVSLPADAGGDFRFHGQWQEAATGLYYKRAREYDPVTGRFLSPDPAEPELYEPESLNRYLFANANPYVFSDPTGRFTIISISIANNVGATLRTIAVNAVRSYLLDKAASVVGSVVVATLKVYGAVTGTTPFGALEGVTNPFEQGRIWEQEMRGVICSILPGSVRDIVWFEPTIRGGLATSPGSSCNGGRRGTTRSGSALPDFVLSKVPPDELGKGNKKQHKAYLIGEFKLRLKTFYNAYVRGGKKKRNQFLQIVEFAEKRVYSRTAIFMALFDSTNAAQKAALTKLISREAAKRKILPVMVSVQ